MHIGRVGSVLATLSVAFERFIAIKYPLMTIERVRSLISISLICSVVYNIPRFFEFKTIYQENSNITANITSGVLQFDNITSANITSINEENVRSKLKPTFVARYKIGIKYLIFI